MNSYTSPPAQTPARSKVIPERVVVTPPTPTHDSKESNQFSLRDATVVQNREPLQKLRRSAGRQFKSTERSGSYSPNPSIVVSQPNRGADYHEGTAAISLTEKLEKASAEKDQLEQLRKLVDLEKQLKMVIIEELRSSGQIE